jgi:isoleucyl-tRNA synthetase
MSAGKSFDEARGQRSYFDSVDPRADFPKMEKELLAKWYQSGLVNKYIRKNKAAKKNYSFLDGPITANNAMGVHHAWGRTYKDLWQRFKNMQGYRQRFQNGFDCQGLWVEVEVEKDLGLKSKKDIENLVPGDKEASIAKFVELCRERVKKYAQIQTDQSKRLGYFVDWDHSYYTLSENNNYAIWHFLKVCYENGWIYKGNDVVPWCPRCETAISQHEILTEDYKEITHKSIYLRLPIVGRNKEYLLIWTTTPWTIPANTAVAVDENLDYALVKDEKSEKYWVASALTEKVFSKDVKILESKKGNDLVGLRYKGPYDYLPYIKNMDKKSRKLFHTVVPTDPLLMPISIEEGTGLVHTSTSTGEEDHKVGIKLGLPVFPAIDDQANYLPGFGDLTGKNAKETPEIVLDFLEKGKWAYRIEAYRHKYPACWRCKSELVWKVTDEWYISMDKPSKISNAESRTLRQRMITVAKKIKWLPGFGLERELDWLTNMHDWLISKKNRYWGLALPIWECPKCDHFEVIGSYEELEKKASNGWDKFANKTPHKPQIDEVKIRCVNCGSEALRIESVGNPWLDAGIVAYSTVSRNNKACEFVGRKEAPLYFEDKKEWRKWIPADFITESFPGQFKNWFYSLIAMSTVLEDLEPFKTVLGYATLFAEDGQPMHKSWGNSISFDEGADRIGVDVMRWMYVRQNPADNLLFGYKIADETRRRFHLMLWNVYNFFVTYANLDGWSPKKQLKAYSLRLTALDEWILARLDRTVKGVTGHLEKYDAFLASAAIEAFVNDLSLWYIRRSRNRVGPAADNKKDKEVFYHTCYLSLVTLSKLLAPFTPFLAEVIYKNLTKEESVHLAEWPKISTKSTAHGAETIEQMRQIREVVEKVHAARKEAGIPVRQPLAKATVYSKSKGESKRWNREIIDLANDELNIKELVFATGEDKVELDTKITPELEEEAKARELIRKIQEQRKLMGIDLTQKIVVTTPWLPLDKKFVQKISAKTLASKLSTGEFSVVAA